MEKKREKQRISLLVNGRKLMLDVAPEEESLYRKAAVTYNQRVNQYRAKYMGDEEFPILMAAVDMALQLEICRKRLERQPVEEELDRLSREVDTFLQEMDSPL